jgi:hypothetical protein
VALTALVPVTAPPRVDLSGVPALLWSPFTIVFLQVLWAAVFLFTGRSQVTGSVISFHVCTAPSSPDAFPSPLAGKE